NNENPLAFIGKFSLKDNPAKVANDILTTLQINPLQYFSGNPIKEWIDKAEAKGIFISRTSFIHSHLKLDSEEIQGFAIADSHAPFVFVNSEDWDAPQLFTLVHELAHLWIAASGVSNEIEPELKNQDKFHPIELFCNEVAANALMPAEIMRRLNTSVFRSGKEVFSEAKKIGVSTFAFLVRAFNLQLISSAQYRKLKNEADKEFNAFLKREEEKKEKEKLKEKKGGPNYYLLQLNKNGKLFTQIVLDAFRGGFVEPTQASHLLNIQVNNFQKLEAQIYR
ncbi:MAG: ImmA/IrrE family metallo-endopeptidase, partial [Bacteroidota bacterium]